MQDAQASMQEIQEIIKRVRMDPRANNKPVLAVNVQALQVAKNGGYPKHLYHEKLDPIIVLTQDEEQAVAVKGYVPHYIPHAYPKWLFRRHMDARFFDQPETQSNGTVKMVPNPFGDYVEGVVVGTPEAEAALRKRPVLQGCGPWCGKVTDIEPLPERSAEDPKIVEARLQGQLDELRAQLAEKEKKVHTVKA